MENKFICEGHKHQLGGKSGGTIFLPVSFENLPKEITVLGHTLYPSAPPLHVSLVYIRRIIEKYNISDPGFVDKIIEDFCNFTKTHDIDVVHYTNEYKFVSKDNKKTVVVMCKVSNLDKFFDLTNEKYDLHMNYMPTHVTLYTLDGQPGAYLAEPDDITNFTVPIENPLGFSLQ